ncbi:MAG: hypothetical protein U0V87_16220 [Acidobacteriota bacterium]
MAALLLLFAGSAAAQQSAGFKIEGSVVNAGGRPEAGVTASSAAFKITLDVVGIGAATSGLSGGGFRSDVGFANLYPPALEVRTLRFVNDDQLVWDAERSVGSYNLYRDLLANLSALGYGACLQQQLTTPSATDTQRPVPGSGFFYLATAVNRLDEEGTKGRRSNGADRGGVVCP